MAALFPSPLLSCAISAERPEKRLSMWKAVKIGLFWKRELCEFMPKKSNLEFELLKCNKAAFFSPLPSPLCVSALNRWQMWRSSVMRVCACWAGKMEASAHFLENPKNLFKTCPNNIHERTEGRQREHERQYHTRLKDQCQDFGDSSSSFVFIFVGWTVEGCQVLYCFMSDLFGLILTRMTLVLPPNCGQCILFLCCSKPQGTVCMDQECIYIHWFGSSLVLGGNTNQVCYHFCYSRDFIIKF